MIVYGAMKQYVIDEIRPGERQRLKKYLDEHFGDPAMDGVYWIPLEEELLSETQRQHRDCQPFYFALELGQDAVSCELLVRTRERVRCDCIAYASEKQRNWVVRVVDAIFEKLELYT
jgi:hypothetical protein